MSSVGLWSDLHVSADEIRMLGVKDIFLSEHRPPTSQPHGGRGAEGAGQSSPQTENSYPSLFIRSTAETYIYSTVLIETGGEKQICPSNTKKMSERMSSEARVQDTPEK